MAVFKISDKGSFKSVFAYLKHLKHREYLEHMHQFAQKGVDALRAATPKDTGETSRRWRYEILYGSRKSEIVWINDNVTSDGDPIVILLQYGHGTGTGGYVRGRDFINPAIQPVFDEILNGVEQAVKSL